MPNLISRCDLKTSLVTICVTKNQSHIHLGNLIPLQYSAGEAFPDDVILITITGNCISYAVLYVLHNNKSIID